MTEPTESYGYTTCDLPTPIDWNSAITKMAEISRQMRDLPTTYVMLHKTLQEITAKSGVAGYPAMCVMQQPSILMGIPVESYGTMKQCLDRMMEGRPGDQPMLVAPNDSIPVEMLDHPFARWHREHPTEPYAFARPARLR